mmetsp:Transcript_56249/g.134279  ORF Transcript_56249/g.134279 Transcript_56249/m.134279 type:complete len:456 (+) Transcript_56249:672-2039(+)
MSGKDWKNAALWFENARDVSKEQGFVTMECNLCSMLGSAIWQTVRCSEAVEPHRRALRVAQSVREDDASHDRASLERMALRGLVEVLCQRDGHLEEAEALVTRLRERGGNTADCQLWNHYLRGMVEMQRQNFQAAAEAFRAAVAVAEKHPAVLQDPNSAGALKSAKVNLKHCGVGAGGAPPRSTIVRMVEKARVSRDWAGVLRWESRLEDLLTLSEAGHPTLIESFAVANLNQGHFAKAASLIQRRVQLLGKLECFAEQGADMCLVGECFVRLDDAQGAGTWYQKARKLGEKHGCYAVECSASLGLGRIEFYTLKRMTEAEELLRHALSVLDFVEGQDETLERDIKHELAKVLLQTDRYEEAGPLIQRLCELAERAGADPFNMVVTLQLAVRFQVRMGDVAQAAKDMQALEDAFQKLPAGVQNASFEPHLKQARLSVRWLVQGAGMHGGMPEGVQ